MANYGMINTGNGDDTITGIANGGNGVGIGNNGSFTGGTIDTGAGNDTITGSGGRHGIINYSTINTGSGNDTITGTSSFLGIVNFGTINTGTGDDTVNALQGGFGGIGGIRTGVIDLGADNDTLIGFVSENFYSKSGDFYGGVGNDKILLGDGVYSFNGVDTIISNSVGMKVYEFESIGGVSGSTFSFADFAAANQLTVSGGVATLS
jgi:hypothetical protein